MTMPITERGTAALRDHLAAELTRTRARSAALTDAIDDRELVCQHSRIMSPLVWDFAHIGNQEELWLVRDVGGRDPVRADIDELYDAFKHPRPNRPALPLLDPTETRRYLTEVRSKVLDVLDRAPLEGRRLVEHGFAFGMIVQHEQQHDETMLATHQLRAGPAALHATPPQPQRSLHLPGEVLMPAGEFIMGTSAEPWSLDNERPAHRARTNAYWLDTVPVTNGDYQRFLAEGGYDNPRWWSERGWAHRCEAALDGPEFWFLDRGSWWRNRFGVIEPVPPDEPVVHVCFFRGPGLCRPGPASACPLKWSGRRPPDSIRPPAGPAAFRGVMRIPLPAHANLGQRHLQPAADGQFTRPAPPRWACTS